MQERKLNYRFHNPNTVEATVDMLLGIFIEANSERVEKEIRKATEKLSDEEKEGVK